MKAKIFLSSIVTIALCLSLIVGSTFALFTKTETVNIAVTAGKVDVEADVISLVPSFNNGGSASFSKGQLTVNKMTPGDTVSFKIQVANNSNIPVDYTVNATSTTTTDKNLLEVIECDVAIEGKTETAKTMTGSDQTYSAGPFPVDAPDPAATGATLTIITVTITFPVFSFSGNVDSDEYKKAYEKYQSYQGANSSITFTVEAVQGNGATTNP